MLPAESMGAGLEKFFVNTLDRNGKGERPDAPVPVPAFGTGSSEASDLCGDYSSYSTALLCGQWHHNQPLPVSLLPSTSSLASQFQQKSSTGVPFELTKCRQLAHSPRAKDVLVPGRPLGHLCTRPPYVAPSGFDGMGRPRVTGTYIPDVTQHHCRRRLSTMGTRKSCSQTHNQSLKSSQKIGQVEDALQTEAGNDNCLDFSTSQVAPEAEKGGNCNCPDHGPQ